MGSRWPYNFCRGKYFWSRLPCFYKRRQSVGNNNQITERSIITYPTLHNLYYISLDESSRIYMYRLYRHVSYSSVLPKLHNSNITSSGISQIDDAPAENMRPKYPPWIRFYPSAVPRVKLCPRRIYRCYDMVYPI